MQINLLDLMLEKHIKITLNYFKLIHFLKNLTLKLKNISRKILIIQSHRINILVYIVRN